MKGYICILFLLLVSGVSFAGYNPEAGDDYLRAENNYLVLEKKRFQIQAISFSNFYYNKSGFKFSKSKHHQENDYLRIKALGFNSVRFAFNGDWFISNRSQFFQWLDLNILWAKKAGVLLILDLHMPIGGDWLAPGLSVPNFSLWEDVTLQDKNTALWSAIAERYKDESTIAAYQLLNEPVLQDDDIEKWYDFVDKTIQSIRLLDKNHLIIVDDLYGINGQYGGVEEVPRKLVNDNNVAYDLHFYEPFAFTHQNAPWVSSDSQTSSRGNVPARPYDKNYLLSKIQWHLDFGRNNKVPVLVTEFGLMANTFKAANFGSRWVWSLLNIFKEQGVGFSYWNYRSKEMGLFLSDDALLPGEPNWELINVFAQFFGTFPALNSLFDFPGKPAKNIGKPSTSPPGNMPTVNVPQFVVLSFDDNISVDGIEWAASIFQGRHNFQGSDNHLTYDGAAARASFYMSTFPLESGQHGFKKSYENLHDAGHELGNHTHSHLRNLGDNEPSKRYWNKDIKECSDWLVSKLGHERRLGGGFRAPFLRYNQAMFDSLSDQGFLYDFSIEEGYGSQFDGSNFRWPYKLEYGSPGHAEGWYGTVNNPERVELNPSVSKFLWELPNYVIMIPDDNDGLQYGLAPGLRHRIGQYIPDVAVTGKITSFDYNLWHLAQLSGEEVLAILKYNLDLRLSGNRAPFVFGLHSHYYTDETWAKINTSTKGAAEMREAVEKFVVYALSKPEVRIRPAVDVIRWLQNPAPLAN